MVSKEPKHARTREQLRLNVATVGTNDVDPEIYHTVASYNIHVKVPIKSLQFVHMQCSPSVQLLEGLPHILEQDHLI